MARNLFIAAIIGGVILSFYGEDKPAVATPTPIESTSQVSGLQEELDAQAGELAALRGELAAMQAQQFDEPEVIEPEATTLTVASGVCAQGSCGPSYAVRSYSTQRVGLFGLRSRSSGRWYLGKNLGRGRLLGRIFRR